MGVKARSRTGQSGGASTNLLGTKLPLGMDISRLHPRRTRTMSYEKKTPARPWIVG